MWKAQPLPLVLTSTLTDLNIFQPSNYFVGGLIWFLSGQNAGKTSLISGFDANTHLITFNPVTYAPAAGDRYFAMRAEYSRADLVSAINQVLEDIKALPQENQSLTTVSGQEEYTLPAGVSDIRRVYISNAVSAPYGWYEHYWWSEPQNGKLRFDGSHTPSTAGMLIRLVYCGGLTPVVNDSDTISDYLAIERLKWSAAVNAMRMKYVKVGKDNPTLIDRFKEATAQEENAKLLFPLPTVHRAPIFSNW